MVSMEVTGVVFRQAPCFSSTAANSRHCHSLSTLKKPNSFPPNLKSFSDESHLQYYNGPRMAIQEKEEMRSKKKEMKKKLKLLKGLSKNLSTFSDMGFCLHPDDGLAQQVKGQMMSEATEVLVGQLQKLKEEKMESKRMRKAKKKASRKDSSESSSSESDCDTVGQVKPTWTSEDATSSRVQVLEKVENRVSGSNADEECGKKIEVCMGGKCKKSGGAMLLDNFQKAVGGVAEVVGCKCMGKCRDGPNVKLRNHELNSLSLGVGQEDVHSILTNFLGGSSPPLTSL